MAIVRRAALVALAGLALGPQPARAQTYPARPIHLIVPYAPGGGADFFARPVAAKMAEFLGQPIVIENKPGAATNLGAEFVAKSAPDGYTLLMGDVATFAVNPSLYKKLPYDAEQDFAPISLTSRYAIVLVVNPDRVKAKSIAELIEAARKAPGSFDIAHAGVGTPFHLAAALFEQSAGVKLNQVPYRGASQAVQGIIAGEVHMMFVDYATARPQLESGRLKALAVAGETARPELPGVPPVAGAAGIGEFDASPWRALVAPAGTPAAVIARLHDAYVAAVADPVLRARLADAGVEPLSSSPEELAAYRRKEAGKWAEVIKAANIQLE